MLYLELYSINESRCFFLKREGSPPNREQQRRGSSGRAQQLSPAQERVLHSLTAARWWAVISEKYGKSLESLLPSREIPAEELNLSPSAEKQRCQMQLCLAVVKQTIYLLNFLKDEPPRPFLCNLTPEPGAGVGSHADTIVILPIPGPLSHTMILCSQMNQILDILQSNRKPYFKCKCSGLCDVLSGLCLPACPRLQRFFFFMRLRKTRTEKGTQ